MISALLDSEIREHTGDLSHSPYWNHDIAATRKKDRTWAQKDIMVLWISMCACVPTYMLASSLIAEGMNWWQAVLTIFLGNCIVLIPMVMNAHAGTKYGIPFPVYCRPAFGILGANVPALLRALVACGWFGIQAWIGGNAIFTLLAIWFPGMKDAAPTMIGISSRPGQWIASSLKMAQPPIHAWMPNQPQATSARSMAGTFAPRMPKAGRQ